MQAIGKNHQGDERLVGIDALRGIAALTIVLFHARPMFWIGIDEAWQLYGPTLNLGVLLGYVTAPLYFGGLAVELFFVLSGYCVHRRRAFSLAKDPQTKLDIFPFLFKRFSRIYPVYFVALCLTSLVDNYVRTYNPSFVNLGQDNSVYAFFASLLALQGIAAPIFGSNTVLWTLSLEIHFYILYPLLYHISRKLGANFVLLVTFIVNIGYTVAEMIWKISESLPYKGSGIPIFAAYWFLWGVGFYIAEMEAGRAKLPKGAMVLVVISIPIMLVSAFLKLWEIASLGASLAFGGLIYWSITPTGKAIWNGSVGRCFAFVGFFSYSVYAIHRPVLLLLRVLLTPNGVVFNTLVPTLLAAIIAVVSGGILFFIIERRTMALSRYKSR